MLPIKIVTLRVEKVLDPKIVMLLEEVQLEPMTNFTYRINKVVFKHGESQIFGPLVQKVAREFE
jgi:hypothetical protein